LWRDTSPAGQVFGPDGAWRHPGLFFAPFILLQSHCGHQGFAGGGHFG
jgi:hypothetical protein